MDSLPRLIPLPVKTLIWLGFCADVNPLVSFIIPFIISLFSLACFPYSFSFSFFFWRSLMGVGIYSGQQLRSERRAIVFQVSPSVSRPFRFAR